MKPVFADTFFFLAILNRADVAHEQAIALSRNTRLLRITTDWVITELADGLAKVQQRERFMDVYRHIQLSPAIRVVPASRALLEAGIALYAARPDKDWSLTDCISFVVMRDDGLTDALTADHHFEQAGFKALLKSD
jgi:predicted nucleic acid-binding protein